MSAIRQNYNEECEAGLNKQVNMELYASYVYMSMAYHFDRDDVASKGFHNFFKEKSNEKREQATQFMAYQNFRGGRIVLQDVKAPQVEWKLHVNALEDTLALERKINESILALHVVGETHSDPSFYSFLDKYVKIEVAVIKCLGDLITNVKRCGEGLGSYQFDKTTMEKLH